jgi:hypothetical protein
MKPHSTAEECLLDRERLFLPIFFMDPQLATQIEEESAISKFHHLEQSQKAEIDVSIEGDNDSIPQTEVPPSLIPTPSFSPFSPS